MRELTVLALLESAALLLALAIAWLLDAIFPGE